MTKIALITVIILCILDTKGQVNEETKFKMFCAAISNFSTAPNYVVITVKNKKTGEVKEICTEAPFVCGAVNFQERKTTFPLDCKKYPARYFEFSRRKALKNISFNLYSKADLDSFATSINVSNIVDQVKNGKLTSKTFMGDRREQIMFAHLMYNNGILMTRGCWAGNICELKYFATN